MRPHTELARLPDREFVVTTPMHRAFDFQRTEAPTPVSFDINGTVIECAPTMSTLALLQMAATTADGGEAAAKAAYDFLRLAIPDKDQWDKFTAITSDPAIDFGQDAIASLAEWLAEVYTGNPTRPTSSSTDSSAAAPSGPGSTAGASPAASTPLHSLPTG